MDGYREIYLKELEENVIPFWMNNCPDRGFGGYFTCLDRDGSIYDTVKFMWMQWRIVYMLSEFYAKLRPEKEWLEQASQGFEFLKRHGKAGNGWYYFSIERDGTPSTAPYSVFSDCFACMGSAALFRATGRDDAKKEALSAYRTYLSRKDNPKGPWEKKMPGAKRWSSLGFHMMQANLAMIMSECLGNDEFLPDIIQASETIFSKFWNPEMKMMFENIPDGGGFDLDSITGRHLNPGHAIESMWFLMEAARRRGDQNTITKAAEVILAMFELGWDREHGGFFYFMDALGKPNAELHWDMKLWWVHCEATIAADMAFHNTGRKEFRDWFMKIHDWTWSHFPDPQYGEWFAYLNRRGEPTSYMKGGKWKTLFHLPRMLLICGKTIDS